MKAGIIINKTGMVLSFAELLLERLKSDGIEAEIEYLIPIGANNALAGGVTFRREPELEEYDTLIFGTTLFSVLQPPLFNVKPVMSLYLGTLPDLAGYRTSSFIFSVPALKFLVPGAEKKIGSYIQGTGAEYSTGVSINTVFRPDNSLMQDISGTLAESLIAPS